MKLTHNNCIVSAGAMLQMAKDSNVSIAQNQVVLLQALLNAEVQHIASQPICRLFIVLS